MIRHRVQYADGADDADRQAGTDGGAGVVASGLVRRHDALPCRMNKRTSRDRGPRAAVAATKKE